MKNYNIKVLNFVSRARRGGDKCRLGEANEDTSSRRGGRGAILSLHFHFTF
jgi:hypothetical protein